MYLGFIVNAIRTTTLSLMTHQELGHIRNFNILPFDQKSPTRLIYLSGRNSHWT